MCRSIPAVWLCLVEPLGAVARAGMRCLKGSHLFRQTGNLSVLADDPGDRDLKTLQWQCLCFQWHTCGDEIFVECLAKRENSNRDRNFRNADFTNVRIIIIKIDASNYSYTSVVAKTQLCNAVRECLMERWFRKTLESLNCACTTELATIVKDAFRKCSPGLLLTYYTVDFICLMNFIQNIIKEVASRYPLQNIFEKLSKVLDLDLHTLHTERIL